MRGVFEKVKDIQEFYFFVLLGIYNDVLFYLIFVYVNFTLVGRNELGMRVMQRIYFNLVNGQICNNLFYFNNILGK